MNILQLEDTIKGLPDEALMQEAQQPSGQVPQFLVISEVQRRSDMRKRHQQQSQEQPQGTVADQVLQEGIAGMAPPSPGMQQAMGGPPTQMMYGGGVVRMANGRQATIGEREDLYPGVALGARNPMSIRQYAQDWEGESGTYSTPSGGEFVEYEDPRYSYRAADRILQTYGREEGDRGGRGLTTLRQVISTYAPPSDKNPTESYVDYVSKMSGIPPDAVIDLSNPVIRSRVLSPMAMFESKTEISPEDLRSQISAIDEGYAGRLPPPPAIEPRSIDVDTSMDIPGISPGAPPGSSGLAGSSIEEVNYPVRQEAAVAPVQPNIYRGAGSTEELLNMIGGQGTLDEPFPSPSLGEINPTIDLPRQEAPSVREGLVTVEEIRKQMAEEPERQNPFSMVGNLEELLAETTGGAGERLQNKIDVADLANVPYSIKSDASKAEKSDNQVSGQVKKAVTDPKNVDLPTVIDPEDNSTKTGIMDSLSRYYRPGANIQQEVARQEALRLETSRPQGSYALQQQKDIQSQIAQERADVDRINNSINEITRTQDTTHPSVISKLNVLKKRLANAEERVNTLSSSLSPVEEKAVPGAEQFQKLEEYLAGLGGEKPPSGPGAKVVGAGGGQSSGVAGDGSGQPGGDVSTLPGVLAEMSKMRGRMSEIPKTDYSDLIAASEARQKESTSKMQRLAEGLAIAQLGAGIAKGDLSSGISKAAEIAGKTKKENLAFRRQEEQVRDAYKLKMAEADSLAKKAELKAEMDILTQMGSVLKTMAISDNERTRLWNTVIGNVTRDSRVFQRDIKAMQKDPAYEGKSEMELIKIMISQMMGETTAPGTSADYSGFSVVP